MFYLYIENKGTNQLRSYRAAQLHGYRATNLYPLFSHIQKSRFSRDIAHYISLLLCKPFCEEVRRDCSVV